MKTNTGKSINVVDVSASVVSAINLDFEDVYGCQPGTPVRFSVPATRLLVDDKTSPRPFL